MKRIASIVIIFFCFVMSSFSQSTEYSNYLTKAKEYESKKQWAFALEAYYDAIGCDDESSLKIDAFNGYMVLSEAIKNGNPGLGKYNPFTIHDAWKMLLIDAEKLGSSICKFELHLGNLEQADLNYETCTASYKAKVQYEISDRYKKTIGVIEEGYKAAYKKDWTDLPKVEEWPRYSVSYEQNPVYDVDGAKIVEVVPPVKWQGWLIVQHYNAFSGLIESIDYWGNDYPGRTLYDYKFNIVDEKGKELVKGQRWLLYNDRWGTPEISIDGIGIEAMDLIDSGKAFINPVAVYLEYGEYYGDDDNLGYRKTDEEYNNKDGRSFVKYLPEVQLDINKAMIYCWNKSEDLIALRFNEMFDKYVMSPIIMPYFEKISADAFLREDDEGLMYKIYLDDSYSYSYARHEDLLTLKDASGKIWEIEKDYFLSILKKNTNLEYHIDGSTTSGSGSTLERVATDAEKTGYENLRQDVVKSYFEKISANGVVAEPYGSPIFEIPLYSSYEDEEPYFYNGWFYFKDSSEKIQGVKILHFAIWEDDFLKILKEITNQEYRFGSNYYLIRNLSTEEKETYYKNKRTCKLFCVNG